VQQHRRTTGDTPRPRIMIAEDHEDTRRIYCTILRHSGYQVEEVDNGRSAVLRAESDTPDLILMDIGLPELDGWQAGRLIKANPATRGIPLVAFSAVIDSTADLRADTETFDGYIRKPISPSELVRRVGAYLELLGIRGDRSPLRAGMAGGKAIDAGNDGPPDVTPITGQRPAVSVRAVGG
jgi:two-component system, cell cycle response regulator DivK